jgi:hypothetical protein
LLVRLVALLVELAVLVLNGQLALQLIMQVVVAVVVGMVQVELVV